MCGINGIFATYSIPKLDARMAKMNQTIAHRGPDADHIKLFNDKLALGHRRLAIIDTSNAADQPMVSNSQRYWIVFNGEIYNYQEIKRQLPDYIFITHSDTEVILAAIESHSLEWFLAHANGMFAFALLDNRENKLYLVRDRFGVKPLYYFAQANKLVFSSEIKGILASGLVEAELNRPMIDDYLAYRYVREPNSLFANIYQVRAAHYLIFDRCLNQTQMQYWQLPSQFNASSNFNEEDILEEFSAKVRHAVDLRLISDVPLGAYLSGGVDSSLITAVAAQKNPQLNTYSIGFPELNEFEYARLVATQYATNHHEFMLDNQDYLDLARWKQLIAFKDAPLGVPNEIALSTLSQELKKNVTVVLSGEGADELIGGYGGIYRLGFEYDHHQPKQSFYDYFCHRYEYIDRSTRDAFLNDSYHDYRAYCDHAIKTQFEQMSHEEFIFRFFHTYHIKGLLQRLDATTMCCSVEGRVPFLDYALVEFCYKSVPYDLKLKWKNKESEIKSRLLKAVEFSEQHDIPKYLLKRMAENYLPNHLIYRNKMGFPVPLSDWYAKLETIASTVLPKATWLKPNSYKQLIQHLASNRRSGQLLWMFINVELFIELYFHQTYRW